MLYNIFANRRHTTHNSLDFSRMNTFTSLFLFWFAFSIRSFVILWYIVIQRFSSSHPQCTTHPHTQLIARVSYIFILHLINNLALLHLDFFLVHIILSHIHLKCYNSWVLYFIRIIILNECEWMNEWKTAFMIQTSVLNVGLLRNIFLNNCVILHEMIYIFRNSQ